MGVEEVERTAPCGCGGTNAPAAKDESARPAAMPEPPLEDLVFLATVVAAGCETCAQKAVARALEHATPARQVQKTLQILAKIQKLDCFAQAVGPEVVARMAKPLAAGQRTLREAIENGGR